MLPAFYVHLWRSAGYPILDQNLWRVFCARTGRTLSPADAPASWQDYAACTGVFQALVADTGLHWCTVGRRLWLLGHGLESGQATRYRLQAALQQGPGSMAHGIAVDQRSQLGYNVCNLCRTEAQCVWAAKKAARVVAPAYARRSLTLCVPSANEGTGRGLLPGRAVTVGCVSATRGGDPA